MSEQEKYIPLAADSLPTEPMPALEDIVLNYENLMRKTDTSAYDIKWYLKSIISIEANLLESKDYRPEQKENFRYRLSLVKEMLRIRLDEATETEKLKQEIEDEEKRTKGLPTSNEIKKAILKGKYDFIFDGINDQTAPNKSFDIEPSIRHLRYEIHQRAKKYIFENDVEYKNLIEYSNYFFNTGQLPGNIIPIQSIKAGETKTEIYVIYGNIRRDLFPEIKIEVLAMFMKSVFVAMKNDINVIKSLYNKRK